MRTCRWWTGIASALLEELHEQLIFELWPLQTLMQQLLHNLDALGCVQTLLSFIHVPLNASKHLDSSTGVVCTEFQQ